MKEGDPIILKREAHTAYTRQTGKIISINNDIALVKFDIDNYEDFVPLKDLELYEK